MIRVCAVSPSVSLGNLSSNTKNIVASIKHASELGASLIIMPELCITGYSCADLFSQPLLIERAVAELIRITQETADTRAVIVLGLPVAYDGRLYNCAAVVCNGQVLGLAPKIYLPFTNEYYEGRWFSSGVKLKSHTLMLNGTDTPFGPDLLFYDPESGCVMGVEVCEDLWAVQPPSGAMALAGANVLVNLSASNETVGKAQYRRELVTQQSARCLAAYIYSSAGAGESTTDLVFSGHCLIAENGILLAETERFSFTSQFSIADIDLELLQYSRMRNSSFMVASPPPFFRRVLISMRSSVTIPNVGKMRPNNPLPFVPKSLQARSEVCREIFSIQSTGLARRLRHIGVKSAVLGISGGVDSSLALLVLMRAFELAGLEASDVLAVEMPGFGTSERTSQNAKRLVQSVGATLMVIPIADAVQRHFQDISHDEAQHDVTYENSQARQRTLILMSLANKYEGIVVGTGDLSESALGWCTFNGDHMSMYHVNIGVPKTLVRCLLHWCGEALYADEDVNATLHDILASPVSPELLPVGQDGAPSQNTENLLGPYELHDFFLYHFVRHGASPKKLLFLAEHAFCGKFKRQELLQCLNVFITRFFSHQFKRSVMPDGPKVGSVALSPRGDWRMPSDVSAGTWLRELDDLSK